MKTTTKSPPSLKKKEHEQNAHTLQSATKRGFWDNKSIKGSSKPSGSHGDVAKIENLVSTTHVGIYRNIRHRRRGAFSP